MKEERSGCRRARACGEGGRKEGEEVSSKRREGRRRGRVREGGRRGPTLENDIDGISVLRRERGSEKEMEVSLSQERRRRREGRKGRRRRRGGRSLVERERNEPQDPKHLGYHHP